MSANAIATPTTLAEVKACNAAHGFHFFEPGAMRFFNSRILSDVFPSACGGFVVFVTSERCGYSDPRMFSVRALIVATGNVETIGGFQRYASRTGALNGARAFAAKGWTLNPEPWESQHKCDGTARSGGPCWRGAQFLRPGHAGSCAEHATA